MAWCKRWFSMWVGQQYCAVPWQRAQRGHGQFPTGIRATCVSANIRLTHLVLSVCVCPCVCPCVCVPFHALFSPSLCEAAPSVSNFICHTSSGLVWSRGSLHTLFMCLTAESRLEVCVCLWVCVWLFTYSMYLCVYTSVNLFLHVCVYTLAYMFVLLTRVK